MKRISRLVFCGIFSLVLIRPVFGLALDTRTADIQASPLALPQLLAGKFSPQSWASLVPPGLMPGGELTPAAGLLTRASSPQLPHALDWHAVRTALSPVVDFVGGPLRAEIALQPPTSNFREEALVLAAPGNAMPSAVTVPEPMGRTLLGLGLGGLLIRRGMFFRTSDAMR